MNQETNIPGFREAKQATYVYVGQGPNREAWYVLSGTKEAPVKRFLSDNVFEGFLQKLVITEREFKGKKSKKLDIWFAVRQNGNESNVVIRAGLETTFARSFLLKLWQSDFDVLSKEKLTLTAYCSDQDEKVVFCSLTLQGKKLTSNWDKDLNLEDLIQVLNCSLEEAEPFITTSHKKEQVVSVPIEAVEPFGDEEIPF